MKFCFPPFPHVRCYMGRFSCIIIYLLQNCLRHCLVLQSKMICVWLRQSLNSQWHSCLSLPSIGITLLYHHYQLRTFVFLGMCPINFCVPVSFSRYLFLRHAFIKVLFNLNTSHIKSYYSWVETENSFTQLTKTHHNIFWDTFWITLCL